MIFIDNEQSSIFVGTEITIVDIICNTIIQTKNIKIESVLSDYISIIIYENYRPIIDRFVNVYINHDIKYIKVETFDEVFLVSVLDKSYEDIYALYAMKGIKRVGIEIRIKSSIFYGDM